MNRVDPHTSSQISSLSRLHESTQSQPIEHPSLQTKEVIARSLLPRSPRTSLLQTLIALDKITPTGRIIPGATWPEVDAFGLKELTELMHFLNSPIEISCSSNEKTHISLGMLLRHLAAINRRWNIENGINKLEKVFLVGSYLNQIEHYQEWAVNQLRKIFGNNEFDYGLVTELKQRKAGDSDWRFYPKGAQREVVIEALKREVVTFFTNKIYWDTTYQGRSSTDTKALKAQHSIRDYHHAFIHHAPSEWKTLHRSVYERAFKGLCSFTSLPSGPNSQKTAYTITSFGNSATRIVDLMFVDSLERDSLFTLDDCQLDIKGIFNFAGSDYIPGHIQLKPKSKGNIWQHIIDQICYVIHIDTISTVDKRGYMRLIGHLAKGACILEDGLEDGLIEKIHNQSKDAEGGELNYQQLGIDIIQLAGEFIAKHQSQPIPAFLLNLLASLKKLKYPQELLVKILQELAPPPNPNSANIFSRAIDLISEGGWSFDCVYALIHTAAFLNILKTRTTTQAPLFFFADTSREVAFETKHEQCLITTGALTQQISLLCTTIKEIYPQLDTQKKRAFTLFLHEFIPENLFLELNEEQAKAITVDLQLNSTELEALACTMLEAEDIIPLRHLGFQLYQTFALLNRSATPTFLIDNLPKILYHLPSDNERQTCVRATSQVLQLTTSCLLLESFHFSVNQNILLTESLIAQQLLEHFILHLNVNNKATVMLAWETYSLPSEIKTLLARKFLRALIPCDLAAALGYFESFERQSPLEDNLSIFNTIISCVKKNPHNIWVGNTLTFMTKMARSLSVRLKQTPTPRTTFEAFSQSVIGLIQELYKESDSAKPAEDLATFAVANSLFSASVLKTPEMWIEICTTILNRSQKNLKLTLFYWEKGTSAGVWTNQEKNEAVSELLLQIIEKLIATASLLTPKFLTLIRKQTLNSVQKLKLASLVEKHIDQTDSFDEMKKRMDFFATSLPGAKQAEFNLKLVAMACEKKQFDQALKLLKEFLTQQVPPSLRSVVRGLFEQLVFSTFDSGLNFKGYTFLEDPLCEQIYAEQESGLVQLLLKYFAYVPQNNQPELLHSLLRKTTVSLAEELGVSICTKTSDFLNTLSQPLPPLLRKTLQDQFPRLLDYCEKTNHAAEGASLVIRADDHKALPDLNPALIKQLLVLARNLLRENLTEKSHLAHTLLFNLRILERLPQPLSPFQQSVFLSLIDTLIQHRLLDFAADWIQRYSRIQSVEQTSLKRWIEAFIEENQLYTVLELLNLIREPFDLKFLASVLKRLRDKDILLCALGLIKFHEPLKKAAGIYPFLLSVLALLSKQNTRESLDRALKILETFEMTSIPLWQEVIKLVTHNKHQGLYSQAAVLLTIIKNKGSVSSISEHPGEAFETFLLIFELLKEVKALQCLDIIHDFAFWFTLFENNFSAKNQIRLLHKLLLWGICVVNSCREPHATLSGLFLVLRHYAALYQKLFREVKGILEMEKLLAAAIFTSQNLELWIMGANHLRKILVELVSEEHPPEAYVNGTIEILTSGVESLNKSTPEQVSFLKDSLQPLYAQFIRPHVDAYDAEICAKLFEAMFQHEHAYFHLRALLILIDFCRQAPAEMRLSCRLKNIAEKILLHIVNHREVYNFVDREYDKKVLDDLLLTVISTPRMQILFGPLATATICSKMTVLKLEDALSNYETSKADEALKFFRVVCSSITNYEDLEQPCVELAFDLLLANFNHEPEPFFFNIAILTLLQLTTGSGETCLSNFRQIASASQIGYTPTLHDLQSESAWHNRAISHMLMCFHSAKDIEEPSEATDQQVEASPQKEHSTVVAQRFVEFSSLNYLLRASKNPVRLFKYMRLYIDKIFKFRTKNPTLRKYMLSQMQEFLRFILENYKERTTELASSLEQFILHPFGLDPEFTLHHFNALDQILPACSKIFEKHRELALKIAPYVTSRPLGVSKFIETHLTLDEIIDHINQIVKWMIQEGDSPAAILRALLLVGNLQNTISELKLKYPKNLTKVYNIHTSYKLIMDAVLTEPLYVGQGGFEQLDSHGMSLFRLFHLTFTGSFLFTFQPDTTSHRAEPTSWRKIASQLSINWLENLLTLCRNYHDTSAGVEMLLEAHKFIVFCLQNHVFDHRFPDYKRLLSEFITEFSHHLCLVLGTENPTVLQETLKIFAFSNLFKHRSLHEKRKNLAVELTTLIEFLKTFQNQAIINYASTILNDLKDSGIIAPALMQSYIEYFIERTPN